MADVDQTDHPGLTTGDQLRELFRGPPAGGRGIVWLADRVLEIAQYTGSLSLPVGPAGLDPGAHPDLAGLPPRVFRTLLARFAKLAADESGREFDPYHGQYSLVRSGRGGPVRLDIRIANTTAEQRLQIDQVPVAVPGPAANGTARPAIEPAPAG